MENYYLFAVICCFLPFIIGGIWFAQHDTQKVSSKQPVFVSSPVIQGCEDLMIKEYSYSEIDSPFSFNSLFSNLLKVNPYDPKTRDADYMDGWFLRATPQLMHDGKCLAYINHYGHIEDTFWENIKKHGLKPEQDKVFQQLLISINKTSWGVWIENFSNLLFHFGKHYQLLPEIENIVNTDARFAVVKRSYQLARECAKKDN